LFSAATHTTTVAQSPLSFFPHHVGDLWQYRFYWIGPLARTEQFDSAFALAPSDLFIRARVREYDPPSNYTVWYLIRDSTYVYYGVTPGGNPSAYPAKFLYKLDASPGEAWRVRYPAPPDTTYREVARVTLVDTIQLFGRTTVSKEIWYGITVLGATDTTWWDTRWLSSGFGLIEAQLEPMTPYGLVGAIIDSVRYGSIVNVPDPIEVPDHFMLGQNFPNPFNPRTTIRFSLPYETHVRVEVFDLLGRKVRTLLDEKLPRGTHSLVWDASQQASGVYYYRLQTNEAVLTRAMLLQK
jgi:hypothetical protein